MEEHSFLSRGKPLILRMDSLNNELIETIVNNYLNGNGSVSYINEKKLFVKVNEDDGEFGSILFSLGSLPNGSCVKYGEKYICTDDDTLIVSSNLKPNLIEYTLVIN